MPISIVCPKCAKSLRARDELAGRRVRCPACQTVVAIPARTAPPPPADDICALAPEQDLAKSIAAPRGATLASGFADLSALEPPSQPFPAANWNPALAQPMGARPFSLPTQPLPAVRAKSGPSQGLGTAYLLFSFTLIPLVFSLLWGHDDVESRIARMIESNPGLEERLEEANSEEAFFAALPDGRIEGAHLSRKSWMHWPYAMISAGLFFAMMLVLFQRGDADPLHLLGIGLATATIGVLSLLMFQFMAEVTQHVWVRGHGIVMLVFFIFKLIGFSYRAAMDPENGFWLSFFGFTVGVGLCEELTKAMPILIRFRGEMALDWRGACLWGLASGVGFGVAEGIIYASDFYNGISGPGIYVVRFISCVGLHAIWSAAVGIMMWHNQEALSADSEWGDVIFGMLKILIIPIVLHGLYDTLLKRDINLAALVIAVMSFGWLAWLIQTSAARDDAQPASLAHA